MKRVSLTRPHFGTLQIVSHWQSVGYCNQRMFKDVFWCPACGQQ